MATRQKTKSPPPAPASRAKRPYFELRPSPIQGTGAFALRTIRSGTRIVEYVGPHISQEEANARYDDEAMERHHTFLFSIDEDTCIDGAAEENVARFINHSCEPNCEAVLEDRRIFICATRTIREGEELVYDYAYERNEDAGEEEEARYVCRCGTPACRGTILAPPKPPKRRRKAPARAGRR